MKIFTRINIFTTFDYRTNANDMSPTQIFTELERQIIVVRSNNADTLYQEAIEDMAEIIRYLRMESERVDAKLIESFDVWGEPDSLAAFVADLRKVGFTNASGEGTYKGVTDYTIGITIRIHSEFELQEYPEVNRGNESYMLPRDHDKALSRAKEIRNVTV